MSLLDYYLFYNEDVDCDESTMPDWTPVEPIHLLELHQRGLLAERETFSHRGWHHRIVSSAYEDEIFNAYMWNGIDGEEFWCFHVSEHQGWQ